MSKKGTGGFTLIELMLAMAIFSVAMLYGLSFFIYGQKHASNSKEVSFALQLAKDDIENAKTSGYDGLPVGEGIFVAQPVPPDIDTASFKRARSVFLVDGVDETYKVISASVTWKDSQNNEHEINLHTVLSPK